MRRLVFVFSFLALSTAQVLAGPNCKAIDAAISANEDFVEFALAGDNAANGALQDITTNFDVVALSLTAEKRTMGKSHIAAAGSADTSVASLAAMENYKLLVESFRSTLPTTLPAAMLDYAGFKLRALAAAKTLDWPSIAATRDETKQNWNLAKVKLTDKAVIDLGESTMSALDSAISSKNAKWLDSAAQILLDSVDLIERLVKNPAKGACR